MGDIDGTMGVSATMVNVEVEEHIQRQARRNIAGSPHCRGPEDARVIFEALGLIPYSTEPTSD